ncbi:hypothetical protein F4860DRAFT_506664 [Xylaria cubensis]|nr:hypothetical protein F4860DRAFT_506664 [Xylaria cubensis]
MEQSGDVFAELQRSFSSAPRDFLFACGGSIPIASVFPSGSGPVSTDDSSPKSGSGSGDSSQPVQLPSSPITLRWDREDPSNTDTQCKLTFPFGDGEQKTLEGLLRDMQPATFGLGGEDVYDESYRKASKMNTSQFASTFNPYELGIVDAVAQMLLPNLQIGRNRKIPELKRGVRAELYKLNVYSGPSGHFRAHVDTPRSVDQFGSLVVCLPVAHTGGQLKVQCQGSDVVFDWATSEEEIKEAPVIQWGAFYSDCLHEVLEVKSGHRITLTYNLYATYGGGAITGLGNAVDVTNLSLYKSLGGVLKLKTFLPEGGYLGFYTTHEYPHSHVLSFLPHTLKGADGTSLGYSVKIHPLAEVSDNYLNWTGRKYEKPPPQYRFVGETLEVAIRGQFQGLTEMEDILKDWSMKYKGEPLRADGIHWLNQPKSNLPFEDSMLCVAYGNEHTVEIIYSECVILAEVPRFEDRNINAPV